MEISLSVKTLHALAYSHLLLIVTRTFLSPQLLNFLEHISAIGSRRLFKIKYFFKKSINPDKLFPHYYNSCRKACGGVNSMELDAMHTLGTEFLLNERVVLTLLITSLCEVLSSRRASVS